jgi:hypothetical protein
LEDGTKVSDFDAIKEASILHFSTLYTQQNEVEKMNVDSMVEHIPKIISHVDNIDLVRPIKKQTFNEQYGASSQIKSQCPMASPYPFIYFSRILLRMIKK